MVILTKLNGNDIMINENNIEYVTETPDTVITMINGHSYIVKESMEEIFTKINGFNRACKSSRVRDGSHREG